MQQNTLSRDAGGRGAGSNQITVVAFQLRFYKNVAKWFLDICNAEMAQSLSSLQKSNVFKVDYFDFSCKKFE